MRHLLRYQPATMDRKEVQDWLDDGSANGWNLVSLTHLPTTPRGPVNLYVFQGAASTSESSMKALSGWTELQGESLLGEAVSSDNALVCYNHKFYLRSSGSFRIKLISFSAGNKHKAQLCVEKHQGGNSGSTNILTWSPSEVKEFNADATDHLEVWQSEHADGHATGDSYGHGSDGVSYTTAQYSSTGGFAVTFEVRKI